jgi:hypothetical protein
MVKARRKRFTSFEGVLEFSAALASKPPYYVVSQDDGAGAAVSVRL